ncbi:MAG TPA: hypothetical protein IAB06_00460, partial [Candidatus Avacidaminococcus intestinavium]|nr:hypothetical protein [Candidatus Avacidaminococcus intestinavium]
MKKLLLSLLAVVFSLNIGIVSAMAGSMELPQDDSESFGLKDNILITSGEIKSIENGRIRVTGDGNYDDIILNMSATVPILNGETGQDVPFKDLKKGKKVVAYYGPFVTRSLPPQGNAVAVVIQAEEPLDTGIYLEVGKVLPNNDDSIRVLSTNEDQLITLGKDVITRLDSIQEGTRLVVWYKMMAMSMPGQATAVKAIVLPPVMKVHLGTGVIVLQGKELP